MKRFLLSLLLGFVIGTCLTWASSEATVSLANSTITPSTISAGDVSLSFVKGDGANDPKANSNYLQFYGGNKLTISYSGGSITKVVITTNTSKTFKTTGVTATTGSVSVSNTTLTWTAANANTSEVIIQNGANSSTAQAQVTKIVITYEPKASSPEDFTFDFTDKSITLDEGKTLDEDAFITALFIPEKCPSFTFSVAESYEDYYEVNNNIITAKKAGDTKLNVAWGDGTAYNNGSATIDLIICKERIATEIAWVEDEITKDISKEKTFTPELMVDPEDVELEIKYSSSDATVATVDADGKITLLATGKTDITASFGGNSEYAACEDVTFTLTVTNSVKPVEIEFDTTGNAPWMPTTSSTSTFTAPGNITIERSSTSSIYGNSNNGYLMIKYPASITVYPQIACSEVKVTTSSTCSTSTELELFVGETTIGKQTLSTKGGTFTYKIPDAQQKENQAFKFSVTTANCQLKKLEFVQAVPKGPQPYNYNGVESLTFELEDIFTESGLEAKLGVTGEHPAFSYTFGNTDMIELYEGDYKAMDEGDTSLKISWDGDDNYTAGNITIPVHINGQAAYTNEWPEKIVFAEESDFTAEELLAKLNVKGAHPDFTYTFADLIMNDGETFLVGEQGHTTLTIEWNSGKGYTAGKYEGINVVVMGASTIIWVEVEDEVYTANMWDGTELELNAMIDPEGLEMTYTSSDETVAKFDENGKLQLLKAGETTITAAFDGNDDYYPSSASFTLTVNDLAKPEFTNTSLTAKVGTAIGITISPEDATLEYTINGGDLIAYDEPIIITEEMRGEDGKVYFEVFATKGIRSTKSTKSYTIPEAATFDFDVENAYGMTTYSGNDTDYEANITDINGLNGITLELSGTYRHWKYVSGSDDEATTTYQLRTKKKDEFQFTIYAPVGGIIKSVLFEGSNTNSLSANEVSVSSNKWNATEDDALTSVTFTNNSSSNRIDIVNITVVVDITPVAMHFYDEGNKVEFGHGDNITLWNGETKTIKFTVGHGHKLHFCDHKAGQEAHAAGRAALEDEDHVWTASEDGTVTLTGSGQLYLATEKDGEMIPQTYFSYTTTTQTGVEGVAAEAEAEAEFFNLQGLRVANPAAGVYIRRQGSTVSKVVIR